MASRLQWQPIPVGNSPADVYERYFIFAVIWAFGGPLPTDGRFVQQGDVRLLDRKVGDLQGQSHLKSWFYLLSLLSWTRSCGSLMACRPQRVVTSLDGDVASGMGPDPDALRTCLCDRTSARRCAMFGYLMLAVVVHRKAEGCFGHAFATARMPPRPRRPVLAQTTGSRSATGGRRSSRRSRLRRRAQSLIISWTASGSLLRAAAGSPMGLLFQYPRQYH